LVESSSRQGATGGALDRSKRGAVVAVGGSSRRGQSSSSRSQGARALLGGAATRHGNRKAPATHGAWHKKCHCLAMDQGIYGLCLTIIRCVYKACMAIVWDENGDYLACWLACMEERPRATAVARLAWRGADASNTRIDAADRSEAPRAASERTDGRRRNSGGEEGATDGEDAPCLAATLGACRCRVPEHYRRDGATPRW